MGGGRGGGIYNRLPPHTHTEGVVQSLRGGAPRGGRREMRVEGITTFTLEIKHKNESRERGFREMGGRDDGQKTISTHTN